MTNKKISSFVKSYIFSLSCLWEYSPFETLKGLTLRTLAGISELFIIALIFPLLYKLVGNEVELNENFFKIFNILGINLYSDNIQLIICIIISLIISTYLRTYTIYFTNKISYEITANISHCLMLTLLNRDKPSQSCFQNSRLLSNLRDQPLYLAQRLFIPTFQVVGAVTAIIPVVLFLIFNSIESFIYAIPLIFLNYFLFYLFVRKKVINAGKKFDQMNYETGVLLKELSSGWRDIYCYLLKSKITNSFYKQFKEVCDSQSYIFTVSTIPRIIIESILIIVLLIPIIIFNNIEKLIPLIGITLISAIKLLPYVQQLFGATSMIITGSYSISKVRRQLSRGIKEGLLSKKNYFKNNKLKKEEIKYLKPDLYISRYKIKHNYKSKIDNAKSYKNANTLNIKIPYGSKVLLKGKSGSGKTSLMDFIVGFKLNYYIYDFIKYEKESNKIPIHKFSYASQNPFLFRGTLIENITLSNQEYDKLRLKKIISALSLNELISKENKSKIYNPELDSLSGGEAQRISIARALYSHNPIVLLDEPTAKLDILTSENLLNSIPNLLFGRTLVIIMHENKIPNWIDDVIEIIN